jgi:hypothetical protein
MACDRWQARSEALPEPSVGVGLQPVRHHVLQPRPNSRDLRDAIRAKTDAYLALERLYDSDLRREAVPADAVMTSASGVDPAIPVANARIQAHRVAAVRGRA